MDSVNEQNIYTIKNLHCGNWVHNYLMQPGDGTLYRFGFQYLNQGLLNYIIDSGVGTEIEYIWFYIKMPCHTGVSTVRISSLAEFKKHPVENLHLIEYLKGHGMDGIYDYTLIAIVLALGVLVTHPDGRSEAASAMLTARAVTKHYRDSYDF